MKLIQLNLWLGHLMHPALDFISRESPDILCAQEVLDTQTPNLLFDNFDLHRRVFEAGGFQDSFFVPCYDFSALGTVVRQGISIFSKYPLTQRQTTFIKGGYIADQKAADFTYNIRALQTCRVAADGKMLTIVNHHGFHDFDPNGTDETLACSKAVADACRTLRAPIIFCGDLNIEPTSPAFEPYQSLGLRDLSSEYKLTQTLSPVHRVGRKTEVLCDYIFVSPTLTVKHFSANSEIVSDHKALLLEFDV